MADNYGSISASSHVVVGIKDGGRSLAQDDPLIGAKKNIHVSSSPPKEG
jgi:hypothetical protein